MKNYYTKHYSIPTPTLTIASSEKNFSQRKKKKNNRNRYEKVHGDLIFITPIINLYKGVSRGCELVPEWKDHDPLNKAWFDPIRDSTWVHAFIYVTLRLTPIENTCVLHLSTWRPLFIKHALAIRDEKYLFLRFSRYPHNRLCHIPV